MFPEYFSEMPTLLQSFWYLAFFASLIFIFQTILTFIGSDASADVDADFNGDFQHIDAPFELFTFRNLINFLLGFGWTGAAFYGKFSETLLVLFAFVVGLIFVAIFFVIIKQILKLQEDNTFDLNNVLGKSGEIYMTIPGHETGSGKVQISIKGSIHELDAMTHEKEKIEAGSIVKVMKIENKIVFVEKI
ncbi:NfeD family protein [Frigoriflavimonas asaccharolytica]|uniref:Membrane protein implicated in regulation of membrane protease activity n=1 Tax=Frigoriflavimonas asaccharolytica TaxID=2735899 RepID=A0A8J8G929_9FLAO|nr:NfeD family protein [Frigoriflavimonas asaccharolytica]NRS91525.1 membrane protein implicated in regulation of membrane protease activity [Frigoriflavimonas asaccharolytica]